MYVGERSGTDQVETVVARAQRRERHGAHRRTAHRGMASEAM